MNRTSRSAALPYPEHGCRHPCGALVQTKTKVPTQGSRSKETAQNKCNYGSTNTMCSACYFPLRVFCFSSKRGGGFRVHLLLYSSGPSVMPVYAIGKCRHYIGNQHYSCNRHYSSHCYYKLFASVPSDFTCTISGSRHYSTGNCCCCCSHIHSHNQVHGQRTGSSYSGAGEYPREKNRANQ